MKSYLKKNILNILILFVISILATLTIENVYGHGVGSEIFPPIRLMENK